VSGPPLDPENSGSRVYLFQFDSATSGNGLSFWVSKGPSFNPGPADMEAVRDAMEVSAEFSNVTVTKSQTDQDVL
jgi:hypothetical protein